MLYTFQSNHVNIEQLARFDFLDLCLLGETGTGKTHTAKEIHELSPRRKGPFIAVNCAELAGSIIESELFGHEKGAFTGAVTSKEGKFEAAAGGTLLLDEIGELDGSTQAKLLKVVEEKTITRVGGNRPRKIDVRIIYATHRDLSVFREDFRYRITAHVIELSPLRERIKEIVPLAQAFIKDFGTKSGATIIAEKKVLRILEKAPWFGNVRELRSFIDEACLEALLEADDRGNWLLPIDLTKDILERRLEASSRDESNSPEKPNGHIPAYISGDRMEDYLELIETDLVKNALAVHNNNRTRAAKDLGISRSGLIKKLKRISFH
ncbi:MAG: sigma 54-interacting transcriptional regulator [Pyrinomonadaceae bacterium]